MIYWGLDYEQFNAQPLALINRLFLLNQVKPFLPSTSWVQSGTVAASIYNSQMGKKGKPLSHDDIFPFMKREQHITDGRDEESQKEMHNKLAAMFG
tara:strand:- start:257 stop:544 length:288 start_codon:yes stop_codon:yes gene_type:complete